MAGRAFTLILILLYIIFLAFNTFREINKYICIIQTLFCETISFAKEINSIEICNWIACSLAVIAWTLS